MTDLLTRFATARRRRVLVLSGSLFVVGAVLGAPATGMLRSSGEDFQDPTSQYAHANDLIRSATGQTPYFNVVVLLRGARPVTSDPVEQRAAVTVAGLLTAQTGFQRVADYSATRSRALVSRDGRESAVLAAFASDSDATAAIAIAQRSISRPPVSADLAGVRSRFGGYALTTKELNERTTSDLVRAELLGLPFLLALSFWFFRGAVAALLPPLVGGLAILLTFLALRVVDRFAPISVFALNLVTGMGLGLGIDYSLFVLYRYREELAAGASAYRAIERTRRTTGRTVFFSSLTVAAAMTSLLLFPMRFLYSMGVGGAAVTICDGAIALLLLPAVLIVLGPRINGLAPAWLQRRAARVAVTHEQGGWWRLASGIVRRPAPVALISAVVLLAAALPALRVKFISPGANLLPATGASRRVEEGLARSFPYNAGESTEIVLRGRQATATRLAGGAAAIAGPLARATPARHIGRATWAITLFPRGSPYSAAQQHLLSRLRALARPYGALVGGASAYFADQHAAIASRIPVILAILIAVTAIFLFLMAGSIVIPIKALVMNMLSVSVAVGLQVLIFQDGHLSGSLGFAPLGGLEESSLVLMIVLAFALATDYEVFVLGRIKEAHDSGLGDSQAIALGIERTGRIVTAAALLFCVAIGALTTSQLFFTKQLGLGAALAVAVDATIVRALLVPALMALMGKLNWWAPAPLRRLHDRIGSSHMSPAGAGAH